MLRDPRDVIVSWFHYVDMEARRHPFARFGTINYKDYEGDERMGLIIENICPLFDGYLPWLDEDITVLRYEDVLDKPEEALAPVAEAVDISLDVLVERSKFRGGKTFRKGVAGEWRHEFSGDHLRRFNQLYRHIMEAWGYGRDT